ncbi:MAG: alpha/beta hydrolase [Armatimonadota bacterium]
MARHSAQPPPTYPDHANLMLWIDEDGRQHPVRNAADWRRRRSHILANMQLVMGEHPCAARLVSPRVQVTEEARGEGWTRRKLTYAAEEGDRVPAYLFIPDGITAPGPAMLCLHQTTAIGKAEPAGLGGLENLHYARELAERGFVTLAPDYPGYGDYQVDAYALGYVAATMKGIWNHERAVDVLSSLPEVDRKRIGVIGHSLGGHNSLFVAAFDERLRVVVTSCGFNSFFKYMGGNLTGWSHRGYMPRIADQYGCDPARMPFDFTEVLGAIAPRAVFVNAPSGDSNFELSGVTDCLNAARSVYELYDAAHRLVAVHPDCGHDFPLQVREQAYAFLARALA